MCLSGFRQLADRLQPGNDFPVRIAFLQQWQRHLFDCTGIEPVLGSIRQSHLGPSRELAPGVILMGAVKNPLCHIRRDAIMVSESESDIGDSLNGLWMQIVLQTPFLRQHGTATTALIDCVDCLLTQFRDR